MTKEDTNALYDAYEVFVQNDILEHHRHVGSLLAPSADVALQLARENFLRREDAVSVWVVRKDHVRATSSEDSDWFARELERDYRRVDGYSDNARKWKAFKQRGLDLEDLVKD